MGAGQAGFLNSTVRKVLAIGLLGAVDPAIRRRPHRDRENWKILNRVQDDERLVEPAKNPTTVCIGAKIIITRNGMEESWEIVGYDESDPDHGKLAYNTPLAQPIIGKKVGEGARLESFEIVIKSIR